MILLYRGTKYAVRRKFVKIFLVLTIMRQVRCKCSAPSDNERIFFVSIRDSYRYEIIISNPDFGCFLREKMKCQLRFYEKGDPTKKVTLRKR